MFGFGKAKKENQRGGETPDDRKIQQMMNEVSSELGINKENPSASKQNSKELAHQMKKEIKKRT